MDAEGNISILSMTPEGLLRNPDAEYCSSAAQATPPPFMNRKCGAVWGFGGKLVTWGQTTGPCLTVHHRNIDTRLADKVNNFDKEIETTDLLNMIDQRIQQSEHEIDKVEFTVMKSLFQKSNEAIFKCFGIDKNKILQEVERFTGKKQQKQQE